MLSREVTEGLNIRSIDDFNKLKEKAIKKWSENKLIKCGFGNGGLAWYHQPIIFPYYNNGK